MEAIVNITTFRGTCVEATHFYGTLHIIGVENEELYRSITQEEIDKDPDRWYAYEEGDLTKCFNSWKDVIVAAGDKAKERGINLEKMLVEGIPNTKGLPYYEALKPLDTRPKCKKCGKVIKPGEGCYNTPRGLFCVKCYK
jgi:hypothetical protein